MEVPAPQPAESINDDPMSTCAENEAAAAVAGLATDMSPDNNDNRHDRMVIHQNKQIDK